MKMTLRSLAPFILVLCWSLSARGQEPREKLRDVNGWTKASWGMTREEIVKAFLGTRAFKDVVVSAPFKIGDDRFDAEFRFSADSHVLEAVVISPLETIALDDLFQRLELMLTEKYGPPTTRTYPSLPNKESVSTSWAFPSTVISLNRTRANGPILSDSLTIAYVKNLNGKVPDNL